MAKIFTGPILNAKLAQVYGSYGRASKAKGIPLSLGWSLAGTLPSHRLRKRTRRGAWTLDRENVNFFAMMAEKESPRRLLLTVHGRVQGVFFRAWTRELANQLDLAGWVRNTPDGKVEILAEGPQRALEELTRRCHQGPEAAKVTQVDVAWEEFDSSLKGFRIRY